MAKVVAGMTASLDGFVADLNRSVELLYPDLEELREAPYMRSLVEETGAVLMGKRAFQMAEDPDWYVGNYEFQVPIFVVTHKPPQKLPKQDATLTFTFVTDGVEPAVQQAKAAAGDKAVMVIGGASVVQQVLKAGLADEIRIDVMPVLLGAGLSLFEAGDQEPVQLEKIGVSEVGPRTTLRFRPTK